MELLESCEQMLRYRIISSFTCSLVQEIHKRARKQFKGLFDKKPGEISEVGDKDPQEEEGPSTSLDTYDREALNDDKEHLLEATAPPPTTSLWSRLWPRGRKLFSTLGLDRCTILWNTSDSNLVLFLLWETSNKNVTTLPLPPDYFVSDY